jgi:hypothetical protein
VSGDRRKEEVVGGWRQREDNCEFGNKEKEEAQSSKLKGEIVEVVD